MKKNSREMRHAVRGAVLAFMVLLGMTLGGVAVEASKTDLVPVKAERAKGIPDLVLTQGMAEVVELPGPISDIMVANPSVIDVMAIQSKRLYVVGVNYGSTNIITLDEEGNVLSRLDVHVTIDSDAINNLLDDLFPNEEVEVKARHDQILLTGHVSTPDVAQKVTMVVAHYVSDIQDEDGEYDELIANMLQVEGEQQVMLRVKVLEVGREVLRELGIESNILDSANDDLIDNLVTSAGTGLTATSLGVANVIFNQNAAGTSGMEVILRALENTNLVNTLAEPNLTAISGESAGFLAGGEFPVPTSRDQDGNIVVDYRPFGVALNFQPTVMSRDRLMLQLETEVSSISNQNAAGLNGLTVPSFAVRRASTTVELGSGGSLMIAGLLQSEITKGLNELPGIKYIPIIGDLISSESFQRQETELVIIVTAYLVSPYANVEDNLSEPVNDNRLYPLATAFADNIRNTYTKLSLAPELFSHEDGTTFGYILD